MTPAQFKATRRSVCRFRKDFAELVNISPRTIESWETKSPPTPAAVTMLRLVVALHTMGASMELIKNICHGVAVQVDNAKP